jgi:Spy/CpxP family protein refolding chaperone
MKLNNTLIAGLMAGSVLTAAVAVRAQDNPSTSTTTNAPAHPHEARGNRGIDVIAIQLGLTDDQKAKARPIIEARNQQMLELRKDKTLDQEARQAKLKQIHDDTNAKLKDVLTDQQFAKWQKITTPHRRPAAVPPATPPAGGTTPAPATGNGSPQ